jgi:uncharacterized membrane protein
LSRLLGMITVPAGPWVWPAVAMLMAAAALVVWSYRRTPHMTAAHKIAFCLKLLGLLVLTLCLVEPLWIGTRAESGANLFVVVADNSSTMNVLDQGSDASRGEMLQGVLKGGNADWLATLADDFQLRHYVFDSQLRRTDDFSELVFDGRSSAIGATLRTIAERYRGRPLAGVLLMTDGGATDMAEKFYDLSEVPPVYPVVVGRSRPVRDISLSNISVTQTSFEDAPVMIQADVEAVGYAGRTVAVDLADDSARLIERRQWKVRKSDEKQVLRFRLRPDRTGVLFYNLKVAEITAPDSAVQPEAPREATLANNHQTVVVDRGKGPYRILYVAGRPNWEYKFLRRALSEDQHVQIVGLLRVAKREPKYQWLGRTGESNNPLYRGFDNKDTEQTEQYDQPVFVRLNTRDEKELLDGFPKTAEELFAYDALILDDVEAEFFSHDQMDLVRRFVTERGGGFLMLGGKESFRKGNYERTPIGRILPVNLDGLGQDLPRGELRFDLTREGWLQPWARLRDNEQDERLRLSRMPEFRVANRVRTVKPGARIIATAGRQQSRQLPGLVVQRFGRGRSAALTIGDIWRWGLRNPRMREDMNKFWRQTLRWLVADVPGRISLDVSHEPDKVNQPVALEVCARDEGFRPMDNVAVTIEVREPGGEKVQLKAEPAPGRSGLFHAVYVPRVSGGHFTRAVVSDPEGNEIGDAETGWAVELEAREFRSIRTDKALLERIARQTSGRLVGIDQLDDFARSLPGAGVPITAVRVRPLWDLASLKTPIFLFVLFCFVAEWALRRWRGMP